MLVLSRNIIASALLLAGIQTAFAQELRIAVKDQRIESGNIVKVQEVTSKEDGFLVIHVPNPDDPNKPGKAIGYAIVNTGSNSNVSVKLEADVKSGERLHAVLHEDTTKSGMFDADQDKPAAKPDGNVVLATFVAK